MRLAQIEYEKINVLDKFKIDIIRELIKCKSSNLEHVPWYWMYDNINRPLKVQIQETLWKITDKQILNIFKDAFNKFS